MAALRRCESVILLVARTHPVCRRLSTTLKDRYLNTEKNNFPKYKSVASYSCLLSILGISSSQSACTHSRLLSFSNSVNKDVEEKQRRVTELRDQDTKSEDGKNEQKSADDKSENSEKTQRWKKWLQYIGFAMIAASTGSVIVVFGSPEKDPEGKEIEDEFSDLNTVEQYLRRAWKNMRIYEKSIIEPSRDKLLPDPLQYPYIQPPYTLVMEMRGVLVHPCWSFQTGWRFKKRPGVDYFLKAIGPPMFETVVYSQETGMNGDPLLNILDTEGHIMYRLYRDATRYVDGIHMKDLSCLNRDLSRVILVDCDKRASQLQKSNAIIIKKYTGEDDDKHLIELAHFLQAIAASKVDDVRPVLEYYSQFDEPLEKFKENQAKLQEEQEKMSIQMKQQTQKSPMSGFGQSLFRR